MKNNFTAINKADSLSFQKQTKVTLGGILKKYANPSLIVNENKGWKEHIVEKYRKV